MEWYESFEPVINKDSKILILGSFPSVKSREQGFYYGHKQNRFWKMLERVFNKSVPEDTASKIQFLLEHKIALWDVIKSSSITGSSDSDINLNNSIPVDFNELFTTYPNINLIICNGKKAAAIFNKFNPNCKIKTLCLPSTSPANVSYDYCSWEKALKENL
ncbi:MAG: DNA-deoxyinosine glycosylase [Clostridia bacterium]|nr:DNA-deoxyinosine glycosylase [Clostridia bacterium]